MKLKVLSLIGVLTLSISVVFSQCSLSSNYSGEILPNQGCGVYTVFSNYSPGTYFRTPVLMGGSYTVSTCGATTDTQLTGFPATSTTSFFYNDDNGPECTGTAASAQFVPTFTDYARVQVSEYSCQPGGSASITVYVRQNNNLSIGLPAEVCAGDSILLTPSPAPVTSAQPGSGDLGTLSGTGVSGSWFVAPMVTDTQTVNISYSFGYCTTVETVTIYAPPAGNITTPSQALCDTSIQLLASDSMGVGMWVSSDTNIVFSPSAMDSNAVAWNFSPMDTVELQWVVTNGACQDISTITIQSGNLPMASVSGTTDLLCNGDCNGTLFAGSGPWNYSWSNGATGDTITGVCGGTHILTVTDTLTGCIDTVSYTINMPDPITATSVVTDEISGGDGAIDMTVTGGTPGYIFDWNNDGTGDNDDNEDISGLNAGTYSVTIFDTNGCTGTYTVSVGSQVSIDELYEKLSVSIYPNPNDGIFTLEFGQEMTNVNVAVVDAAGRLIFNFVEVQVANGHKENVNISEEPNGLYFLKLNTENGSAVLRIIKK